MAAQLSQLNPHENMTPAECLGSVLAMPMTIRT